MHVSGQAGPPLPAPSSLPNWAASLLTSSLVLLLLLVGARGKKKSEMGGCVRHVLVCVVGCVWVGGGESSGVTRWSCRTRMYILRVALCRMRCGRGDEGAREIPRWRRGAACCASVCPCFHLRVAWLDQRRHTHPLWPKQVS